MAGPVAWQNRPAAGAQCDGLRLALVDPRPVFLSTSLVSSSVWGDQSSISAGVPVDSAGGWSAWCRGGSCPPHRRDLSHHRPGAGARSRAVPGSGSGCRDDARRAGCSTEDQATIQFERYEMVRGAGDWTARETAAHSVIVRPVLSPSAAAEYSQYLSRVAGPSQLLRCLA